MNNFLVTFIAPYIKKEQSLGVFNNAQISIKFSKIPWYEKIIDCFYQEPSATKTPAYIIKKKIYDRKSILDF